MAKILSTINLPFIIISFAGIINIEETNGNNMSPAQMHNMDKNIIENFIEKGTSLILESVSFSVPKNASFCIFRKAESVNTLAKTAPNAEKICIDCTAAIIIINLLKNPAKGGIPEIDIVPTSDEKEVIGILFLNPPN